MIWRTVQPTLPRDLMVLIEPAGRSEATHELARLRTRLVALRFSRTNRGMFGQAWQCRLRRNGVKRPIDKRSSDIFLIRKMNKYKFIICRPSNICRPTNLPTMKAYTNRECSHTPAGVGICEPPPYRFVHCRPRGIISCYLPTR